MKNPSPHYRRIETYTPNPKQDAFHRDPSKYRLLLGAWGAGKSAAGFWEHIAQGTVDCQGALHAFFRKTGPALRDTTIEMFYDLLPDELIKKKRLSEGHEECELVNGTRFWFRSLDDWRKLGSTQFDSIFVDEAEELEEADFRTLRGRLRGTVGPRRMVLATNPPNIDHWLYEKFVQKPIQGSSVHSLSMFDNAEHLGWDYINDQMANLTDREKRKYVEGKWGFLGTGDPVFPGFSDAYHVADLRLQPNLPIYRGWDFGFHHPACSWGQILPSGHVNVLAELVMFDTPIDEFASQVLVHHKLKFGNRNPVEDFCDIAGRQMRETGTSAVQVLRSPKFGLNPQMRKLSVARTVLGIRRLMQELVLGRPRLQIDTSCRFHQDAMAGGYRWNVKKDEPDKDAESWYDDIMDAFRYWVSPALINARSRWQGRAAALPMRVAV